jgi:hypothetical protein
VKFSCEIVLPPNSPNSPFGLENRRGDGLVKNSDRKCDFWKKDFGGLRGQMKRNFRAK